ncbi:MAG: hypothetical protein WA003_08790 [Desulfuromonadaceae bacterium]
MLAVACCHQLLFFRNDRLPQKPLKLADAILSFKPAEHALSICAEWSEWPAAESLMEGLVGDIGEFEPKQLMADHVLKCWNAAPLPGWTPVHRGCLGMSFVRNVVNNQTDKLITAEVTSNALYLYNKPLEQNEALKDQDVMKRWNLHDLEPARLCAYLDAEDIIQTRLMMRYNRMWLFQYFLSQEALPF